MTINSEIEDLRAKLNIMISAKDIITNDLELLDLSVELDKKINIFIYNEYAR
ncbi:aspartyl-phosphate phosphatase Spo0E family protein [Candidatus Clostridium radicumherbarum]|jgi:hypothetical protein|uniref:Aspartyl-phosphate phosphatase Spo0E family protein n=1 Tax=Candidatus Clostridium radicumherbarum TaxID=3381662 RepID=A0ABW8TVN3_9CLOT